MSFTFWLQNYEKNLEKPNFFKGKKVKRDIEMRKTGK